MRTFRSRMPAYWVRRGDLTNAVLPMKGRNMSGSEKRIRSPREVISSICLNSHFPGKKYGFRQVSKLGEGLGGFFFQEGPPQILRT
jgi:hypothetical protein